MNGFATTGEPARTRWMLSTITWSPGFSPFSMIQLLPTQLPACTSRARAVSPTTT